MQKEDSAKLDWLRDAAQKGFQSIVDGKAVTLRSEREIRNLIRGIGKKSSIVATKRKRT